MIMIMYVTQLHYHAHFHVDRREISDFGQMRRPTYLSL